MAFDKMELRDIEVWDGNFAAAQALRQCQIDVVAAYPITPSTPIVEGYAKFLADGYVEGEFVMVESEHAAMSGFWYAFTDRFKRSKPCTCCST